MANKKPVTAKASKKTNRISKSKAKSRQPDEVKTDFIASNESEVKDNIQVEKSSKIDKQSPKNNRFKSNIKWITGGIIFIALILLYYFQSEQIKNNERTQVSKIEHQLEKFQINLADTLVKNQNNKIEKINQDLDKILKANALLSEQNQSLVDEIYKLVNSDDLTNKPLNETKKLPIQSRDDNSVETKKLLIAIEKAQKTVKTLESALKSNKLEKNISINLNEIQFALSNGNAFWVPLSNIANQLNLNISKNMQRNALVGIKTLEYLRESFPKNARNALKKIEIPNNSQNLKNKALAYLKTHIITRSLTPISGDSVNAILSRAENNLKLNNLDETLRELDNLSDDLQLVMSNWLSDAKINQEVRRELSIIFKTVSKMRENND